MQRHKVGESKRASWKDYPVRIKGLPQDMADTIRFLVGPKARYITGQTIHVNGGAFLAH